MTLHTDLQRRILDVMNHYAPTVEEILLNERATAAWEADARRDPTGYEAAGLADLQAVRRKLNQLYWCNTFAQREHPLTGLAAPSNDGEERIG